jgi:hypothetical protein
MEFLIFLISLSVCVSIRYCFGTVFEMSCYLKHQKRYFTRVYLQEQAHSLLFLFEKEEDNMFFLFFWFLLNCYLVRRMVPVCKQRQTHLQYSIDILRCNL